MDESAAASSNPVLSRGVEDLSDYLDKPNAIHRRTASLAIVRSGVADGSRIVGGEDRTDRRTRSSRRVSLSSWRARPRPDLDDIGDSKDKDSSGSEGGKKKGTIWNWKPVRALSHLGKHRAGCLFSVEVVFIRGLPASMDGLRLTVVVRKEETRDGAVQTMPSRVLEGSADFDETLFVKCNLYFSGGANTRKPLKLDARRFVVSAVAIGAPELDFGKSTIDLSSLVLESVERSFEGRRLWHFDKTFKLSGKATGGELVLKLGFQLMEDGGFSLYSQASMVKPVTEDKDSSSSLARVQTKNSFSVTGPKVTASDTAISPSMRAYKQLVDSLRIDEHGNPLRSPIARKSEEELVAEDSGLPEYEVIDKGIETTVKDPRRTDELPTREIVKDVVHYRAHRDVLDELDSIAEQIEAIEALMSGGEAGARKEPIGDQPQQLNAEEEKVTREFLRMLELEEDKKLKQPLTPRSAADGDRRDSEKAVSVPDLGKGLGPVIQTRDGGFLVSMNPFDMSLTRKDGPKLAMQMSRPFVLQSPKMASEVFLRMAAMGADELRSKMSLFAEMDELMGKTAEQIAFEGIASAIISGPRSKEGANSRATRSIQIVRKMASAISNGRKERIATNIWNVGEDPETLEEILVFSLQKMEAMAVDALKIQAEMADEDAPFDVSSVVDKNDPRCIFDSMLSPEDWIKSCSSDSRVTLLVAIQLRDPSRRYEAVGAPMIAVVQAVRLLSGEDDSGKFKVTNLHVGGVHLRSGESRNVPGGERQKLTAMQWMVDYGPGKAGKRTSPLQPKVRHNTVWSISTRVLADMWLKTMRNPDVKVGSDSR